MVLPDCGLSRGHKKQITPCMSGMWRTVLIKYSKHRKSKHSLPQQSEFSSRLWRKNAGEPCYGKRPTLPNFVTLYTSHYFGWDNNASALFIFEFYSFYHDFLTLFGFQNQGESTTGVSGAVRKHTGSAPNVTDQEFRAVFRACDSQVISSQFPCCSSDSSL